MSRPPLRRAIRLALLVALTTAGAPATAADAADARVPESRANGGDRTAGHPPSARDRSATEPAAPAASGQVAPEATGPLPDAPASDAAGDPPPPARAAAAHADPGGLRIAVIDPNRIVEESPQYRDARAMLSAEVKEREASLRQQQEEIDQLTARLERDAALMSADEASRLQNDIRARTRKLRYAKSEVQEEFALRQTDLRTKLVAQVEEVVRRLAKEKGIDLIVSEGVVFYSERVDISAEVIERLTAEFERR